MRTRMWASAHKCDSSFRFASGLLPVMFRYISRQAPDAPSLLVFFNQNYLFQGFCSTLLNFGSLDAPSLPVFSIKSMFFKTFVQHFLSIWVPGRAVIDCMFQSNLCCSKFRPTFSFSLSPRTRRHIACIFQSNLSF